MIASGNDCASVWRFHLSGLLAGRLELGLLAHLLHLLVLGEAVGVLRARRVVLLPQDLPARRETAVSAAPFASGRHFSQFGADAFAAGRETRADERRPAFIFHFSNCPSPCKTVKRCRAQVPSECLQIVKRAEFFSFDHSKGSSVSPSRMLLMDTASP